MWGQIPICFLIAGNVANLIAKFSTAATTEEKEKENGGNGGPKQKMGEEKMHYVLF
jgi:hypothetical protein